MPVSVQPPVISDWEQEAALRSLNPKAAPGSDDISAEILILSLPAIKCYLSAILRTVLQLRLFPSSWKRSKVVVIGKPNKLDYTSLKSFRPISLVSNLAKILEKVVLGRLLWFANAHDWLKSCKHGFRENKSTDAAAHFLISFIESAFSEKRS
jgi:hypothetical protein